MKLSVDRHELKGLFGGAYYETYIQVTLTPEEEKVAQKQGIMRATLIGGDPRQVEATELYLLCNQFNLTMKDLTRGITAKVDNGSQLGKLASFENQVRECCKNFKSNIEADHFFCSGGSKAEEEF